MHRRELLGAGCLAGVTALAAMAEGIFCPAPCVSGASYLWGLCRARPHDGGR